MGILYLVATPIGNLDDITVRAINTLLTSDYVACEDTRRSGQLIKILHDKYAKEKKKIPKLIPFYDEIEENAAYEIVNLLKEGASVALISDSGTPLISDPGFKLVRAAISAGIEIISLPGASAVVTALILSGLPPTPFMFMGFPPTSESKKRDWFEKISEITKTGFKLTLIFFEAPHRLGNTLKTLETVVTDLEIVICRELTKIHQEIWRGKLSEAVVYFKKPRGEFVVLFNIPQG